MIVLIGQSHDDVLYFENILRKKKVEEKLFNTFPVISGFIFNQEVTIVYDVVTSYICGLVTSHLIEKHKPLCVLLLGKCKGVTSKCKSGDIAISRKFIPVDVDQCEYFDVKVGEIPTISNDFHVERSFLDILSNSFEASTNRNVHVCSFLSANKIYSSMTELEPFGSGDTFLGHQDEFVLDSDCISPFIYCKFYGIPFASVKVVDCKVGEKTDIDTFVKTLDTYSKVGKCITSFIGEIGRRDLI